MISIVNVGSESKDPEGWCTYEVRINYEVIATFRHKRSDGLRRCLQLAAQAAEAIQQEAS